MRIARYISLVLFGFASFLPAGTGCSRSGPEKVWIERWAEDAPLNLNRAGLGAVSSGNRIYAIGGGEYLPNGLKIFNSVEYTEVRDNGRLADWRFTASLKTPRIYLSSVVYAGQIYAMGGEGLTSFYSGAPGDDPPTLLDSIERTRILPDGSLGEWILEKERMHYPRRGGELFVLNGWLYAVGGFNGVFLRDAERAKIHPDGSLGKWGLEKNLTNQVRYISGYAQKENRLYLFGGHLHSPEMAMETVESSDIAADASIAGWREATPMTTKRFLGSSVRLGETIFVVGGQNTITLSGTEHADLLRDGTIGPWVPDTPLNIPRRAAGAVGLGNALYVIGGMNGPIGRAAPVNAVEVAYRNPGRALGHPVEADGPEYRSYLEWKRAAPLDAQAYVSQALDRIASEEYRVVLYNTGEAVRIDPLNYQAYNIRADALYRMGETGRAIEALNKSLEIKKDNFDALMGLGNIRFNQSNFPEAVHFFEKAAATIPDSIIAHEQLGKAYLRSGYREAAAGEFERVLDQAPDSPSILKLLELARPARNQ